MPKSKTDKDAGEGLFIDINDSTLKGYSYKMLKVTVTKGTLKKFQLLRPPYGHARYIRSGKSTQIGGVLLRGLHWESPLVVERTEHNIFRILDGGHRREGMEKFFEKKPKAKLSFYCAVYDFNGLPEDERRKKRMEIFTLWNKGTKQSTDDFIATHQDSIPTYQRIAGIKKEIPCNIYGAKINEYGKKVKDGKFGDTMKFKDFVGGYFASQGPCKTLRNFQGGYSGSAEKFVSDCQDTSKLSDKDVDRMNFFWEVVCDAFNLGPPYNFTKPKGARTIEYAISKTTPFYALMRLILTNDKKFDKDELVQRLKRPMVAEAIIRHSKVGGREACKVCYKDLWLAVNDGYKHHSDLFLPILSETERKSVEEEIVEFKQSRVEYADNVDNEPVIEDVQEDEVDEEDLSDDKPKWSAFRGKYK